MDGKKRWFPKNAIENENRAYNVVQCQSDKTSDFSLSNENYMFALHCSALHLLMCIENVFE